MLYSRFWHKVLFDRGHVSTPEPFKRLVNQGMILGEMEFAGFQDSEGNWIGADRTEGETEADKFKRIRLEEIAVEKKGEFFVLKDRPEIRIDARMFKMSKSRDNVINPETVVDQYGADSLRLYEMFMGPLEATKPWNMRGVEGVSRFLNRVWRLVIDTEGEGTALSGLVQEVPADADTQRILHQTIKRVTEDLENLSFNTAIAAMMEFCNHLTKQTVRPRSTVTTFVLLLSPFAPHIAEELWHSLGNLKTLAYETWPVFDERLLKAAAVEVPVQINGKIKAKIMVDVGVDQGGP